MILVRLLHFILLKLYLILFNFIEDVDLDMTGSLTIPSELALADIPAYIDVDDTCLTKVTKDIVKYISGETISSINV